MNLHKTFSDIERDINDFYVSVEPVGYTGPGPLVTALKVAGRALAIATEHSTPEDAGLIRGARQTVWDLLTRLQNQEPRPHAPFDGADMEPGDDAPVRLLL